MSVSVCQCVNINQVSSLAGPMPHISQGSSLSFHSVPPLFPLPPVSATSGETVSSHGSECIVSSLNGITVETAQTVIPAC